MESLDIQAMGGIFSCGQALLYETTESQFVMDGVGIAYLEADAKEIVPITKIHQNCGGVSFERGTLRFPCSPRLLNGI